MSYSGYITKIKILDKNRSDLVFADVTIRVRSDKLSELEEIKTGETELLFIEGRELKDDELIKVTMEEEESK